VITSSKPSYAKSDLRYWEAKVGFQRPGDRNYSIQIQFQAQRRWINLQTPNKKAAAAAARKFYETLRANGWQESLRRHRPAASSVEKKSDLSIGEYLAAVQECSSLYPKTLAGYASALRKIAADIQGISGSRDKKSPRKRAAWRQSVEAIKLASLTPGTIERWRVDFVRHNATDPLKEKSARVSANSFIRRARALFQPEILELLKDRLQMPQPIALRPVKPEKLRVNGYRSSFDVALVVEDAKSELASNEPEQYKIFLLAVMVGLRRNEIDKLPWNGFRWNECNIRIETTQFFRAKSRESEADVPIDPKLLEIFRGYHARAGKRGHFVIESKVAPKPSALYDHYRCQTLFRKLNAWLRAKGVVAKNPLHTLRKEYGSQINALYGLTAAQEVLRHADIQVTAAHYVENKQRPVWGFGHLLASAERSIIPIDKVG
jgi:integrase